MALFNACPARAQDLSGGIMAIGVYITYKILDVADLTSTAHVYRRRGLRHDDAQWLLIWRCRFCAFIAGMLAGLYHGHGFMGIPAILQVY